MTRTKRGLINKKNCTTLKKKLARKLSDAEFTPFLLRKMAMPGRGASSYLYHYKRCQDVIKQATITEDDIAACQHENDTDRERARNSPYRNRFFSPLEPEAAMCSQECDPLMAAAEDIMNECAKACHFSPTGRALLPQDDVQTY